MLQAERAEHVVEGVLRVLEQFFVHQPQLDVLEGSIFGFCSL
jgi:hypothetical protein